MEGSFHCPFAPFLEGREHYQEVIANATGMYGLFSGSVSKACHHGLFKFSSPAHWFHCHHSYTMRGEEEQDGERGTRKSCFALG